MHKLTLCMIVKNENTDHFRDCLESVSPYIDYYVIADNGSTDGTQDFIKDFFNEKGIPGEVHEVEWVNFGHNRTEAIRFCEGKTHYILMIDADDRLVGKPNMNIDEMIQDGPEGYGLRIKRGDFTWWRNQIFRADAGWEYKGVLHEYAYCGGVPQPHRYGRIDGDYYIDARTLGARNKDHDTGEGIDGITKYSRDAEILESALNNPDDPAYEPTNSRYQFYLGQSYFDSQQWAKAEEAYSKRATMGGWTEEVFYSVFRVAMCKLLQEKPWTEAQDTLLQAWNIKPDRAEPLYHLARIQRMNNNPNLGYLFSKAAMDIAYPKDDILFINDDIYKWQVMDEFASCAYYVGDIENGFRAARILSQYVERREIPEEHHERIRGNLQFYEDAFKEQQRQKESKAAERDLAKQNRIEQQSRDKEAIHRKNETRKRKMKAKKRAANRKR